MKTWVIMLIVTCAGTGIGVGITMAERLAHQELFLPADFEAHSKHKREANPLPTGGGWPKLEFVNGQVYEFGSMERYSKQHHTFLIKNVGDGPLSLAVERTTCKCTISSVDGSRIMPGDVGKVEVEWTGQTLAAEPEFKQMVEISTTDPKNPMITLVISGYVTETVRALPSEVILGRVSSNTGTDAEFQLFGFRSEALEVLDAQFEDPETADRFEVVFEPLPEDEVKKEKGASCGLLAKLSVKSGLPLGPINQTIRIHLQADKEATIELPVRGQSVSDIVIASSSQFEAHWNLLSFGPLRRDESAKAVLQVFVRGEHRHATKLSVGERDPAEYLHVDISPPEELNNGKTIRYLVTIEIPAGLPRINRLGAEYAQHGRVVLETTHPVTKQIPIRVKFAVD